jgi:tRNA (guanine37-N1)-methyltransferase
MDITVVTLFPEMFSGPFDHSIIKRAVEKKLVTISLVPIRDFATDSYKTVDDHPYGGGHGMILRVDIVDPAIQYAKKSKPEKNSHVVLLDPQGVPYTESHATKLCTYQHLILVCGHYEGIDERIRSLVDENLYRRLRAYSAAGYLPRYVDSVISFSQCVHAEPNNGEADVFQGPRDWNTHGTSGNIQT